MPTRPIRTFTVLPHLPERLQSLQKLAYNLWWCWNPEAVALFRRVDAESFEALDHNPVALLGKVDQARLEELQDDDGFLAHLDRVEVLFDIYMNASTWYQEKLASGSFWKDEGGRRKDERKTANSSPSSFLLHPSSFPQLSSTQYIAYFSAEF